MQDFYAKALELFPYTQKLRRDFHVHPELGFQEVRTAGIVARELSQLGMEVTTGVAQTGVVGMLEGKGPGPVVLLRFDMDALPIDEQTGATYASQTSGVMHACGHDGHTAIGLTAARMLNDIRDQFSGSVKFIFQPAEEGLGGAEQMVNEGVLENPHPDVSLALHVWNDKPIGWVGVTPGPAMASAEVFRVRITGSGGHGALPNTTRDPILAAAQVISSLQSIVARNVDPLETAVVSVTQVHGGDAFNVIPSVVQLDGTIRTFNPDVRTMVLHRFEEIVSGVCAALGCQAEISLRGVTPAVVNHPEISARVQEIVQNIFPGETLDTGTRTMGSEDASLFMQDIPGCYFFVGSANSTAGLDAPHHHPKFDFDEGVLPRSASLIARAAVEFLGR